MTLSPHQERGPRRVYANDAIGVHWEPKLCIHARTCVRRLGQVFDSRRRPWVDVDGADPDAIAATVLTCLCRCGASANKPFCDGSHRRVGFSTGGEAD